MQTKENKSLSPLGTFLKKFRRQHVAVCSFFVVLAIVLAGLLAPWLAPYDPHRSVTDQYQEKGLDISNLTSVTIPLVLKMSDGSSKSGSELGSVTAESADRQVAAVRKTENGVRINATNDGSTSILVTTSGVTARIKAVVSHQDNGENYLSQLIVNPPDKPLQSGESVKAELKAVLTDGSELAGAEKILAYADQTRVVEASKPVPSDGKSDNGFSSSGFSNSEPAAGPEQSPGTGIMYQSLNPAVAEVSEDGTIRAVGDGSGVIQVSFDGLSTLIPVSVNQPLSEPVPVTWELGERQVELINAYKHQPPSESHWFGTDHQNRDILSRVLLGTRETLLIGFVSVAIGAVIGTVLGLIAGYYGRWIDALITRFTDVLLAFPGILLAIAVIALLGPGITNIIFAVAVFTIPIFIRIVRGSTLALKEMTYVEAAKSIGVRDSVIIMRHIFPGTMSVVMVYLTMRIGTAILIGASLSFLGLGGDITAPEWGAMLSAAKDNSRNLFHPTFFPGLAIVLTVLSFNLLGDGLRDALDPKLKD